MDNFNYFLGMYAIMDKKTGLFHIPFFEFSQVDACRRFDSFLNSDSSIFNRYKNDFVLYKLGDVNLKTGVFTDCNNEICDCSSIVNFV